MNIKLTCYLDVINSFSNIYLIYKQYIKWNKTLKNLINKNIKIFKNPQNFINKW